MLSTLLRLFVIKGSGTDCQLQFTNQDFKPFITSFSKVVLLALDEVSIMLDFKN
jgi:hypothetical protein